MSWRDIISKLKVRKRLINVFWSAGLYLGDAERPIYPKIISVNLSNESTTITFTLPNGLDPKLIAKNDYVFSQYFGKSIDIDGDYKRFTLTVYTAVIPTNLAYKYEEISPVVAPYKLGIIAGKDRNGRYVAFDLTKQPHILIAGETGSGKSTQLRSILTTLIKTKKPSELQLYLGDCKKSEFHLFRNVEHVQCVHSSPRDIRHMLDKIKMELDRRSDLTEVFGVGHVAELPKAHRVPYIVVAIDEFVMLRKDAEIMDILTEVVAIGRTLGVFAILSMQRPNAKVLDTTIRANLTVSMGFKLRDKLEARIVNTPGAEEIENEGRFIMNSDKLYEIQAPYLSMEQARKLLDPFTVAKGPVKEVRPERVQLSEKDVFNDVD